MWAGGQRMAMHAIVGCCASGREHISAMRPIVKRWKALWGPKPK